MREMDESAHQSRQNELSVPQASAGQSPSRPPADIADPLASEESSAIAAAIDDFAANAPSPSSADALSAELARSAPAADEEAAPPASLQTGPSESSYVFETPAPDETPVEPEARSGDVACTNTNLSPPAEPPFANYSIVPYAGNDIEDIT